MMPLLARFRRSSYGGKLSFILSTSSICTVEIVLLYSRAAANAASISEVSSCSSFSSYSTCTSDCACSLLIDAISGYAAAPAPSRITSTKQIMMMVFFRLLIV